MYKFIFKPAFDILFSVLGIVFLFPLFFVLAMLLAIVNKGNNPFFCQRRPGKNGKVFNLIKFKTMTDDIDSEGNLLSDEKRLTKLGSFIRKTSLDEIPQLINILKTDMSFIGPRPLLVEYLPLYNDEQKKRHLIKPGITGWAQVNGRNAISWQKKLELDVWYVENISFLLDLKIIYLTFKKVTASEGINSTTHVTMEKFNGNN
jgi:lipopolysaccharide/colanic/teichoic acid biosynthesis glycosyltransferase